MEGVILCGIQASGKSTFYVERFLNSHFRISMDLLNTRNKEQQLIEKCIDLHQRIVIDNTNPTKEERAKYIALLKESKYKVICYYFKINRDSSIKRNGLRRVENRVPVIGIYSTISKFQVPDLEEGFDEIHMVVSKDGKFIIKPVSDEV